MTQSSSNGSEDHITLKANAILCFVPSLTHVRTSSSSSSLRKIKAEGRLDLLATALALGCARPAKHSGISTLLRSCKPKALKKVALAFIREGLERSGHEKKDVIVAEFDGMKGGDFFWAKTEQGPAYIYQNPDFGFKTVTGDMLYRSHLNVDLILVLSDMPLFGVIFEAEWDRQVALRKAGGGASMDEIASRLLGLAGQAQSGEGSGSDSVHGLGSQQQDLAHTPAPSADLHPTFFTASPLRSRSTDFVLEEHSGMMEPHDGAMEQAEDGEGMSDWPRGGESSGNAEGGAKRKRVEVDNAPCKRRKSARKGAEPKSEIQREDCNDERYDFAQSCFVCREESAREVAKAKGAGTGKKKGAKKGKGRVKVVEDVEGGKDDDDECRYKSVRSFDLDGGRPVGVPYFLDSDIDLGHTAFQEKFGRDGADLTEVQMGRIEAAVAPMLIPLLKREIQHHLANKPLLCPWDPTDVRVTCDSCWTTIFSGYMLCKCCGRSYCLPCYDIILDPNAPPPQPRLINCHDGKRHLASNFQAISRMSEKETTAAWRSMVGSYGLKTSWQETNEQPLPLSPALTFSTNSYALPADPASIPTLPFAVYEKDALTDELFDIIWDHAAPFVMTGAGTGKKLLGETWTRAKLVALFKKDQCEVEDCENSEITRSMSIADFFAGTFEGRWKLKDWPPHSDFESMYPALYRSFINSNPARDWLAKNGANNLYAHFPDGVIRFDPGPKTYAAQEGNQEKGCHGTTRLHQDRADAFNTMLIATRDDEAPPCACWDVYPAEYTERIRAYLRKRFAGLEGDPIANQQIYLDAEMRRELAAQGVLGYRIYQYPGQTVFVPAGCCHQVVNLANCVKVALDFISPHSVKRFRQLENDFRKQNLAERKDLRSLAYMKDLLQLNITLWFAWLSCCQARARLDIPRPAEWQAFINAQYIKDFGPPEI